MKLKRLLKHKYQTGGKDFVFTNPYDSEGHQSKGDSRKSSMFQGAMENMDVHDVLGGIGAIPGIGEGADLVNAALYGIKGDKEMASLSLLSAVPFLGYTGMAGRQALKLQRTMKGAKGHKNRGPLKNKNKRRRRTNEKVVNEKVVNETPNTGTSTTTTTNTGGGGSTTTPTSWKDRVGQKLKGMGNEGFFAPTIRMAKLPYQGAKWYGRNWKWTVPTTIGVGATIWGANELIQNNKNKERKKIYNEQNTQNWTLETLRPNVAQNTGLSLPSTNLRRGGTVPSDPTMRMTFDDGMYQKGGEPDVRDFMSEEEKQDILDSAGINNEVYTLGTDALGETPKYKQPYPANFKERMNNYFDALDGYVGEKSSFNPDGPDIGYWGLMTSKGLSAEHKGNIPEDVLPYGVVKSSPTIQLLRRKKKQAGGEVFTQANPTDWGTFGPMAGKTATLDQINAFKNRRNFGTPGDQPLEAGDDVKNYIGKDMVDIGDFSEVNRTRSHLHGNQNQYAYGRNLNAAMLWDPYTNLGSEMGKGVYRGSRFDRGFIPESTDEYGNTVPQSGEFFRRYNLSTEKSAKKYGHKRMNDQPIMKNWGDANPVHWSDTGGPDGTGGYVTRNYEEDQWAPGAMENLGNLTHFEDSQLARIGAKRNRHGDLTGGDRNQTFGGLFGSSSMSNLNLSGRQSVKGQVKGYVEGDRQSTNAIEKYLEGKNMTKTTRRDQGTLNIQRDKVKEKRKGFVRKTGEGFLGLQNRKKYIDGVEQERKGLFGRKNKVQEQAPAPQENISYDNQEMLVQNQTGGEPRPFNAETDTVIKSPWSHSNSAADRWINSKGRKHAIETGAVGEYNRDTGEYNVSNFSPNMFPQQTIYNKSTGQYQSHLLMPKDSIGFRNAEDDERFYNYNVSFPETKKERKSMFKRKKKKQSGGQLPGGMQVNIPGSDATKFIGNLHSEGGIQLNQHAEVEGGETMDQVNLKRKGGGAAKSDYIFSSYLNMDGSKGYNDGKETIADRHEKILQHGGSQKEIDKLAYFQEKQAGRDGNKVALQKGGWSTGEMYSRPTETPILSTLEQKQRDKGDFFANEVAPAMKEAWQNDMGLADKIQMVGDVASFGPGLMAPAGMALSSGVSVYKGGKDLIGGNYGDAAKNFGTAALGVVPYASQMQKMDKFKKLAKGVYKTNKVMKNTVGSPLLASPDASDAGPSYGPQLASPQPSMDAPLPTDAPIAQTGGRVPKIYQGGGTPNYPSQQEVEAAAPGIGDSTYFMNKGKWYYSDPALAGALLPFESEADMLAHQAENPRDFDEIPGNNNFNDEWLHKILAEKALNQQITQDTPPAETPGGGGGGGQSELPVASTAYWDQFGDIKGMQNQVTIGGKQFYLNDPELKQYITDHEDFESEWMSNVDPEILEAAGITSFDDMNDPAKVEAYQIAWNEANPDNKIKVDSMLGEQTLRTAITQQNNDDDVPEDDGGILPGSYDPNIYTFNEEELTDKIEEDPDDEYQWTPQQCPCDPSVMDGTPECEAACNPKEDPAVNNEENQRSRTPLNLQWLLPVLGAGAQLIAPLKAQKAKPYTTAAPLQPKQRLERADFNAQIATENADHRAMAKFIETSGGGPANFSNMMAAQAAKRRANMNTRAEEAKINASIANAESKINAGVNKANQENIFAANVYNSKERARVQENKIKAWDAFGQRIAGMAGDYMGYLNDKRHIHAIEGGQDLTRRNNWMMANKDNTNYFDSSGMLTADGTAAYQTYTDNLAKLKRGGFLNRKLRRK